MNSSKKVKGFTLVELIVVIAIISILSGMISLVVTSFVRNARMETCDDYAHMVYTGFQNMLIQCEMKQDSTMFSHDETKHSDLMDAIVTFKMSGTKITELALSSDYDTNHVTYGSGANSTSVTPTGDYVKYTGTLSALANAIMDNIDNTFEGEARVYIDYNNYEVKSVIYQAATSTNSISTNLNSYVKMTASNGFTYYGLFQRDEKELLASSKKTTNSGSAGGVSYTSGSQPSSAITCGAYPYLKELASV